MLLKRPPFPVQFSVLKGCEELQWGVVQRQEMEEHFAWAEAGVHCSTIVPPWALAMMPKGTTSPASTMWSVRALPK